MESLYILGAAATCLLVGMNVFDEVRARRERNKRNQREIR
jgi:hypothetical protein